MDRIPRTGLLVAGVSLIWLTLYSVVRGDQQAPAGSQQMTLEWTASLDPTVVGYNIYYGVSNGLYTNKTDVGSNTSFVVTGLAPGTTYSCATTSYNIAGIESVYSSSTYYTTPVAPCDVNISNLNQIYDGKPARVTVFTTPSNVPVDVTYNGSSAVPTKAGIYKVIATVSSEGYTGSATNTLTISSAPLMVTAGNQTRAYGVGNPLFTPIFSGFVNGDNVTALDGALSFTCPADAESPPGVYPIIPSGLSAANYSITYAKGTLTVGYKIVLDTSSIGDAGAKLTMTAIPGNTYGLQASTDLVNWVDVNTVTATPGGIVNIVDPVAGDYPRRFYRVKTQ